VGYEVQDYDLLYWDNAHSVWVTLLSVRGNTIAHRQMAWVNMHRPRVRAMRRNASTEGCAQGHSVRMEEDIPWLDSSELIEADSGGDKASYAQDSLPPIELDMELLEDDEDEAPGAASAAVPKRSKRAVFATLGGLAASAAGLALLASATRVNVRSPVAEHGATRSAAAPVGVVAPPSPAPGPRPSAPTVVGAPRASATQTRSEVSKVTVRASGSAAPSARSTELRAAFASLNAGKPQEALDRARAILKVTPERADAWLVVGSAYDALHDRVNALAAFRGCAERAQGPAVAACKQLARD
jgi:tetratricopeptide (TPR) repeat protein